MNSSKIYAAISSEESLITPAIEWLQRNGADPKSLIENALRELQRRGRALPKDRRVRYAERVALGEFFARWAAKNREHAPKDLSEDENLRSEELQPFELALIAAGDEKAFTKLTPRFARRKQLERMGQSLGTAEEFTTFVAENTWHLAAVFLKNFDSTRKGAAAKAVRYLQMTAVNWYLVRRTRPIRTDAPNLEGYLDRAKLKPRTILAVKLAYLPALLTGDERSVLRDTYGFSGSLGPRMPIKDIAKLLGFRTPAALSRRLYRVREWCRSSVPTPRTEEEAGHEC